MPNENLVKKINTPPASVLVDFAEESELIDFAGTKIQALYLGSGDYGETYLYKDEAKAEYRVLKVFKKKEMGLGNIERRVSSFNYIYTNLYDHELSPLATATTFNGSQTILDMPYIGGVNYFDASDSVFVRAEKIQKLLLYFKQYDFFVSDYDLSGNIMRFVDPESRINYFLIRDVDLVGRRDSYLLRGNESVTYAILKDPASLEHDIDEYDFFEIIKNHPIEEIKKESTEITTQFADIKSLLLQKLTEKHAKYTALSESKNFQELCSIAAHKRNKYVFSKKEGFTDALDKLYDLLKNDKVKLAAFKLPDDLTKYDLQEIGFFGVLQMRGYHADFKLREKNLKYIYSIQENAEEFKADMEALKKYSIFMRSYKELHTHDLQVEIKMGPFVIRKGKK